ncbi:hypothetical protein C2869_02630 [Saccharobesus litoralis]|uniref:Polymerase beta nucleotidyltransferase domain-containing protein n=2 Tax=Saccharobesus litoralis TaxID=2172099 RepID=A0A2S0VMS6_9ALTE|nr:hypothetical protein C2869_02630 [Saccharobesus litoralis]
MKVIKVVSIYLFGSLVKLNKIPSDIDIAVISKNIFKLATHLKTIFEKLKIPFSIKLDAYNAPLLYSNIKSSCTTPWLDMQP